MKIPCDPYKQRVGFYILSYSIPCMFPCMCCCFVRDIDYSCGHRTSSSNIYSGTVLTLHTSGFIRLSGAITLMTVGNLGISRKFYPSRVLFSWMALLPKAYPAQKLLPRSCSPRFHCVLVALLPVLCPSRVLSVQVMLLYGAYLTKRLCYSGLIRLGDLTEFTRPIGT